MISKFYEIPGYNLFELDYSQTNKILIQFEMDAFFSEKKPLNHRESTN